MKSYKVIYSYNHYKFGFQNQITVQASTDEEAINVATSECVKTYGEKQIKKFSFKIPPFGTN